MKLIELLNQAGIEPPAGLPDRTLEGLHNDSRRVGRGQLFALLPSATGGRQNSAAFLRQAKAAGAAAALAGKGTRGLPGLPMVRVEDPRGAFARCCAAFHGQPSRSLRLAGVTGTNGKTTTTFLLSGVFRAAGLKPAVIGTVGYWLGDERLESVNTTPGPLELQGLLAEALRRGCAAGAMEVSSHALHQRRVEGTRFEAAAFTNLTRDHLDYHRTMAAYRAAKAGLFAMLEPGACAALNQDDPAWKAMRAACGRGVRVLRWGLTRGAELTAVGPRLEPTGTRFALALPGARPVKLRFPMPGRFNLQNALAAAALAHGMGLPAEAICAGLEKPSLPPGRFEPVDAGQPFGVIVDYAHTPDALERALAAVREFTRGRVIVVFGCGGDRDHGKRPQMGAIAHRRADLVIVTSDNPRTEDPEAIVRDVMAGIHEPRGTVKRALGLADRRAAIRRALKVAKRGDTVLLAGKGHEDYQVIGTHKVPFDDRAVARELLGELA